MDDYGKVVYLDVQKTGSTYVSAFLKAHLNLRHLEFHKHAGARKPIRPDTFYFISTRHPVQQWLSLYQYGCAGKGHIWKRMRRTPQAGVTFDQSRGDFERFLRFALAADNAPALAGGYDEAAPALYGLQTFRFLALCLRAPERKLKEAQTRAHLARIYRNSNFTAAVVKTESLSADLLKLCDGPLAPHLIDRPKAVAFLRG